jgi:hypothetical protein
LRSASVGEGKSSLWLYTPSKRKPRGTSTRALGSKRTKANRVDVEWVEGFPALVMLVPYQHNSKPEGGEACDSSVDTTSAHAMQDEKAPELIDKSGLVFGGKEYMLRERVVLTHGSYRTGPLPNW